MPIHFEGTEDQKRALDAFVKLTRASESVGLRINLHLQDYRLTVSQFGVLEALFHLGPLQPSELGTKILKSNANMTVVIDNLVRRNLVARKRKQDDRRCIEIQLAKKGRALIAGILPHHVEGVVTAFEVLTPDEQQMLSELCRKLGRAQSNNT